jgi:hypothetical protein
LTFFTDTCVDPDLFHAMCVAVFRYVTRGQYIPVHRATSGNEEIDLVELGIARFVPRNAQSKTQWFLDEPVAIAAFLAFCSRKKSFDNWLAQRLNTSNQSTDFVYEDIVIHRLRHAFTSPDGCLLKDILNIPAKAPWWASIPVRLAAPRLRNAELETTAVDAASLPYSCSASTWAQTISWISGHTLYPMAICSPDNFMGPDLLCLVEFLKPTKRRRYLLLSFQIGSGSSKSIADALRTLNPKMFWMHSVSSINFGCSSLLITVLQHSDRKTRPPTKIPSQKLRHTSWTNCKNWAFRLIQTTSRSLHANLSGNGRRTVLR